MVASSIHGLYSRGPVSVGGMLNANTLLHTYLIDISASFSSSEISQQRCGVGNVKRRCSQRNSIKGGNLGDVQSL